MGKQIRKIQERKKKKRTYRTKCYRQIQDVQATFWYKGETEPHRLTFSLYQLHFVRYNWIFKITIFRPMKLSN